MCSAIGCRSCCEHFGRLTGAHFHPSPSLISNETSDFTPGVAVSPLGPLVAADWPPRRARGCSPSRAMAGGAEGSSAGGGGGGAATTAGRQIDAFTVQEVVIEKLLLCLEAWGDYALLGLSGE